MGSFVLLAIWALCQFIIIIIYVISHLGTLPVYNNYHLCCFQFVTNWMKIVMGAREAEGVDFWWLDWGQGSTLQCPIIQWWKLSCSTAGETWIKIPLVNPTFWLNYIFFTDPYHWNTTVRCMQDWHNGICMCGIFAELKFCEIPLRQKLYSTIQEGEYILPVQFFTCTKFHGPGFNHEYLERKLFSCE